MAAKGWPDSALSFYRLARVRVKPEHAEELSQVFLNMGDAFAKSGHTDSAIIAYDSAVFFSPENDQVLLKAATYFGQTGVGKRADSLFERASKLAGGLDADSYFNWGLSLLQRGQLPAGIEKMNLAVEHNQQMYQAYYCIAAAYAQQGQSDQAKEYLDRCLRINTEYPPAVQLKRNLEKSDR